MLEYLVLLTIPLTIYGVASYLKDTITGRAKPNKITWLLWAVAPIIAVLAQLSRGVTWAVLPVFMSGFGPLCIFIASLFSKKSYWKLTAFDYICGFFSVLALVLWQITKEANIAIVFAIIADSFAAIPTLRKGWNNPETETIMPFVTGIINALTGFFAIKYWHFSEYGFTLYLFLMDAALIFSVYGKRITKSFLLDKKRV
jgi:hypothetical protein